ncbi:MAG: hypothetical protein K2M82_03915 [Lachnospiraceae bacterium]|nr:hypothetical protein [Lachnospiraceae bacterium]
MKTLISKCNNRVFFAAFFAGSNPPIRVITMLNAINQVYLDNTKSCAVIPDIPESFSIL